MELQLTDKVVAVGGATSGLGEAIALRLLTEGARVIGIGRRRERLDELQAAHPDHFTSFAADVTDSSSVQALADHLVKENIYGCLINAGGPPSGGSQDFGMKDWDEAYRLTFRWKIQLATALLPALAKRNGGRLLFLESVSIKQPIDNLILSNAFRPGVAGFAKTISREYGDRGVTANVISPGYHATDRITSVLAKAADLQGISREEAEQQFVGEVPVRALGQPEDFATLATYLLSPLSGYITGQTISVDGGLTRHLTG